MNVTKKYFFKIFLCIGLAFFISTIWWRYWTYSGLFGSPGLILKLFPFDGETAYDMIHVEMFIICLIMIAFVFWLSNKIIAKYFKNTGIKGD
jgi:hypothetical protein